MYELKFDEKAIDFLEKLQKHIKERIFSKLLAAKNDPFHFFERLEGKEIYKLRVGDYRILADIDNRSKSIQIVLIRHRKNVYDRIR